MAEKILIIDTKKLSKSYNLRGYTRVRIDDTKGILGNLTINNLIKSASAAGNILSVTLNNKAETQLTFNNFNTLENIAFTLKTKNFSPIDYDEGVLADAILSKIGTIYRPQNGTAVKGSILDDDINLLDYDAKTSKKISIKIDGNVGNDTIRGSKHVDVINGGDGDDIIYASWNNDTITGSIGNNTIYYGLDDFGNDTINLTKNENLTLIFNEDLIAAKLEFSVGKNKSDLLITVKEGTTSTAGTITVRNVLSKDLGAKFKIIQGNKEYNVYESSIFKAVTADTYFEISPKKINARYTGTAVADIVDASGLSKATNIKGAGVTISGMSGNDSITGSDYNDTLKGGTGDDTLKGGKGNDQLFGEDGTNTFVFDSNSGNDTITSGKGTDILRFEDNSISTLTFTTSGKTTKDLNINYGNNTVTVKNYYDNKGMAYSSVKYIENEGRRFNIEQLREFEGRIIESQAATINATSDEGNIIIANGDIAQTINGGKGNDFIYASNSTQACTIYANDGDDIIYGSNAERTTGHDSYYTGKGNNTVYAGDSGITNIYLDEGNDIVYTSENSQTNIYVDEITADGGHDKIYWQGNDNNRLYFNNTDYDEIAFTQSESIGSNNLAIRYGNNNSVLIKDYLLDGNQAMGTNFYIEPRGISLYDSIEEKGGIKNYVNGLEGTEENDYIMGTDLADTINAYGGNDFINPGKGNDTIYLGSGNDIIIAGDGSKNIYAYSKDNPSNTSYGNNLIKLGSGNNTVRLGTGADTIKSGTGNNTICFQNLAKDTGNDVYQFGNGDDKLDRLVLFGDNLSDLIVDRRGANPVLIRGVNNPVTEQKAITIKNYNVTADATDLTVITNITNNANNSDLITDANFDTETNLFNISTILGDNTANADQTLSTGNGNDNIYTGFGNDVITTGIGDNLVHLYIANSGNNNIYTRQGAELDTFVLENNLSFDSLQLLKSDNDLLVAYNGDFDNNTVKIIDYYSSKAAHDQHVKFKVNGTLKTLGELFDEKGDGTGGGGGDDPGGDTPGGGGEDPVPPVVPINVISSDEPTIWGDTINDDITATGNIKQYIYACDGDDIIRVSNHNYSNVVIGNAGNDTIIGSDTTRIDTRDEYHTGPGNNKVYAGNNSPKIYLGPNNDTVYTSTEPASITDIYIDCKDNAGGGPNGGYDTIVWRGCKNTNIIFENNSYHDITFTRGLNSDDLILRYGYANSVTLKNYFKTDYEDMGNCIFIHEKTEFGTNVISIHDAIANKGVSIYAAVLYGTTGADTINGTTGNDLIYGNGNDTLIGKTGDDDYIVSSINNLTTIIDEAGTDTVKIKNPLENINVLFNVQKNGTFAEGQNKYYFVNNTVYTTWQTTAAVPTSGIVIEDFHSIGKISTSDNYSLNYSNLLQLKADVANWLKTANGGYGYTDVHTALTSGDENIGDLIAIFDNASWTQSV